MTTCKRKNQRHHLPCIYFGFWKFTKYWFRRNSPIFFTLSTKQRKCLRMSSFIFTKRFRDSWFSPYFVKCHSCSGRKILHRINVITSTERLLCIRRSQYVTLYEIVNIRDANQISRKKSVLRLWNIEFHSISVERSILMMW